MQSFTLSNGVKIPVLGYGVYQVDPVVCERCVIDAVEAGYRHIDTAQAYFNEEGVGNAVANCGVKREELFLTTKIWIDNFGYEKAKASIGLSLKKLKTDYIDLMLIHQPFSDYYGAYRALEEFYRQGIVRAIGVSNFYPDRLSDVCAFTEIPPQVNQVEINPVHQQIAAQRNMTAHSVQAEAWAPFGEGRKGMFENPVLQKLGEKHGKSVAQVILRWLIQRGIVALAKTVRKERMAENLAVFDFELTEEEMRIIAALDENRSLFFSHYDPETVDFFLELIQKRRRENQK